MTIGVIIGSLRKESWNRKLAHALIDLAPANLALEIVEIGSLPLYNQDLDDEGTPPQAWTDFRQTTKKLDGFLFITPEYNRSIPAPLKNAIDVGSRPYGQSIWSEKPGGVISSSLGAISGFGANQHLRQTFVFLDIRCMQQPEAYISNIDKLFTDNKLTNEKTQEFLTNYLSKFAEWINYFDKK